MKKYSAHVHRLVIPHRIRKPLTYRELRRLISAADRDPLGLDLKLIAALVDAQE